MLSSIGVIQTTGKYFLIYRGCLLSQFSLGFSFQRCLRFCLFLSRLDSKISVFWNLKCYSIEASWNVSILEISVDQYVLWLLIYLLLYNLKTFCPINDVLKCNLLKHRFSAAGSIGNRHRPYSFFSSVSCTSTGWLLRIEHSMLP